MYETGMMIHAGVFIVILVCMVIRLFFNFAKSFINDTEYIPITPDVDGDETFHGYLALTVLCGFIGTIFWPAIYVVGIPTGTLFLLRNYKREQKRQTNELKEKIKAEMTQHEDTFHTLEEIDNA